MNFKDLDDFQSKKHDIGNEMYQLMKELFPICRSITGNGVRQSLEIIKKHICLDVSEVSTGTKIFDWIIPKEWNINDGYIIDPNGKKIVDFKNSNLHILNYSIPIKKNISLEELKPHLHTLPDQPDMIPYLTTYYKEDWGFCLSHNQYLKLKEGEYEVVIDSSLENGSLTYGESYIKGKKEDEFVISCYICHPSMCNDNLSGVVLTTFLSKFLSNIQTEYSYRFLFIPETIGAIAWLSLNEKNLSKIKHGLVASCVGDPGPLTYKRSRKGNTEIDIAALNVLKNSNCTFNELDFFPSGSDERQFCSPGFNLPFGSLVRTSYGKFPEYHTSSDDLDFVQSEFLIDTMEKYMSIIFTIENNQTYQNLNPKCEPQLGKRGLYRLVGGTKLVDDIKENSLLWVLNYSDGNHSLLDISEKSNYSFKDIKFASDALLKHNLLTSSK